MSNKLFVGNLSFDTTENELQDAFAAHGTVTETNLMMDRTTGRPRGFGFVTMSSPAEAQKAIEALNGAQLGGRALTVNIARPAKTVLLAAAVVAVAVAVLVVNTAAAAAAVAAAAVAAVIDRSWRFLNFTRGLVQTKSRFFMVDARSRPPAGPPPAWPLLPSRRRL